MTVEGVLCTVCAIYIVAYYIWAKASGQMWYGIQWRNVFRAIIKLFK